MPPSSSRPLRRPEVLAPAGTALAMKAAVENGADAVYFGLERWNARERAENFKLAELPGTIAFLHRRGVKGYVTFNTLVYESELSGAEDMIRAIADAGTDAIIVQDVGVARLAAAVAPGLPVHASTQMTVTDAASAEFARSLGATRAIVGRELSVEEVAAIAAASPIELEVFVHGALCVSYSGQCFTSASWGGRSANRGECAQACRLPYDLLVDGAPRDLSSVRYLLSPQDLVGHDFVPGLAAAGVVSLKIEGRLKSPEYVAMTTATYRLAVDRAMAGRGAPLLEPDEMRELAQVFSRGASAGFLGGTNHQTILDGTYPRHRGVRVGAVAGVDPRANAAVVDLEEDVSAGDGVVFLGGDPERPETEPGGRVFLVEPRDARKGTRARLVFDGDALDVRRIPPRAAVYRNSDPALARRLAATFEGESPRRREGIALRVSGRAGEPLLVEARDRDGRAASAETEERLEPATESPLDAALVAEKLGRLGGTPFELGEVEIAIEGDCRVPVSALNRVRRELVRRLEAARVAPPVRPLAAEKMAPRLAVVPRGGAAPATARVVPLCRDDAHLEGAIEATAEGDAVILDFMEQVGLARAATRARAARRRVVIAPPRIQKPGDEKVLDAILALAPDEILVRSLGALERLRAIPEGRRPILRGDFSLNVANAIAARHFLGLGLATIVPSYDLSFGELLGLLAHVDPARVEVVAHQHLPMFHTEYCAYARLLSTGTSFHDCGRPCEKHKVALRDRVGEEHPVVVDVSCRNTVFASRATSVADDVARLAAAGVRLFRVECLREDRERAAALVRGYRDVAAGRKDGAAVRTGLGAERRLGTLAVE